jgi:hypothetical protein
MKLTLLFTCFVAFAAGQSGDKPDQQRIGVTNIKGAVPPDPRELVVGTVESLTTPDLRAAALALLQRSAQNTKLHTPSTPPYSFTASFTAFGETAQTGTGQLSETWWSGREWRWTASLGGVSVARTAFQGQPVDETPTVIVPTRIHMLRNAIWFASQDPPANIQIRTSNSSWQGKPVTCVLTSGVIGAPTQTQGRLWEESESCIDNQSGRIMISSLAPGTYTVYGYDRNINFHGRMLPDHITIYAAGRQVIDSTFDISDATTHIAAAAGSRPTSTLGGPIRMPLQVPGNTASVQPVIIHASVGGDGHVSEAELSATSDSSLVEAALTQVRGMNFGPTGGERQIYVNVKFVPNRPSGN